MSLVRRSLLIFNARFKAVLKLEVSSHGSFENASCRDFGTRVRTKCHLSACSAVDYQVFVDSATVGPHAENRAALWSAKR